MALIFIFTQLNYSFPTFFSDPFKSAQGIIMTDNYCSAIYLIDRQSISEIVRAPGCGRYYALAPDKKYIGFKCIQENGLQIPSLYDLENRTIISLAGPADQTGQPSFSNDGRIAFSIGESVIVKAENSISKYIIGIYCNLTPISPNGKLIAYNDIHDQIFILDLNNAEKFTVSDNKTGYYAPGWAPNSSLILYSSLDGNIFVYDLDKKQHHQLGPGINPSWSTDSRSIVFQRMNFDRYQLISSDIYQCSYDGSNMIKLTDTPDLHEMDAKFIDQNQIIYHTYERGEIIIARLNDNQLETMDMIVIAKTAPQIHHYNIIGNFGPRDSIDVPYINQVYDTPDWHNGHWSCAPTAAMMAIAYYRKLPYWDCWSSSPYGHTSHFGNYICAQYNYREFTYSDTARDPSNNISWGGYGYMWYNGFSPYSRMVNYINYHDVSSWTDNTPSWNETLAEIQAGFPYCMCVGLTTAGHLVLAVGQVSNWHTLIFNDPYGNKNTPGYPSYDGKYARYDWPGYNNGYQNLNQVYWCRGARGSWQLACDTIVDDLQFRYTTEPCGFFMFNQPPSTMRYFRDNNSGYRDHFWWTYSTASADTCYVTWTPSIPQNDSYEVFTYIPAVNANADARYQIHHDAGTTTINIDQSIFSNEWVSLGSYRFTPGSAYVYLGDATGTPGQRIAFDAVKWGTPNMGIRKKEMEAGLIHHLQSSIVQRSIIVYISDQMQAVDYRIYDITGQCIKSGSQCPNNNKIVISGADLPNGIYFLQMSDCGFDYSEKFIVVK